MIILGEVEGKINSAFTSCELNIGLFMNLIEMGIEKGLITFDKEKVFIDYINEREI